jgi:hypothetical protein
MQLARPIFAVDPRRFGRGPVRDCGTVCASHWATGDLKLFATTFLAGFLFVSVLIA